MFAFFTGSAGGFDKQLFVYRPGGPPGARKGTGDLDDLPVGTAHVRRAPKIETINHGKTGRWPVLWHLAPGSGLSPPPSSPPGDGSNFKPHEGPLAHRPMHSPVPSWQRTGAGWRRADGRMQSRMRQHSSRPGGQRGASPNASTGWACTTPYRGGLSPRSKTVRGRTPQGTAIKNHRHTRRPLRDPHRSCLPPSRPARGPLRVLSSCSTT